MSVAAQSALPPPSPARMGMCLASVMRAPKRLPMWALSACAACMTRLRPPTGSALPLTVSVRKRARSNVSTSERSTRCMSMSSS